ncbi:MAG: restriction endonuclease [Candidatus Marsarchaeota archaeon]|nr:restriction endonuclease [Candidatus Marsarchaeota archaeon]
MHENSNHRSVTSSSPEWKRFQDFVASVERVLGHHGTIESPAYVKDPRTGRQREVDVLIRLQEGRREIRIAFECRRRKGVSDIMWIEQLVGKRENLGIDRVVAVSSKPFSKPAVLFAMERHIELMQLSEFYDETWKPWLLMDGFTQRVHHIENACAGVVFADQRIIMPLEGIDGESTVFRNSTGKMLSFLQLWHASTGSIYEKIPVFSPPMRIETVMYVSENDPIYMDYGGSDRRVLRIHVEGNVWVDEQSVPFLPAVTYRDVLTDQVVLGYAETAIPVVLDGKRCYFGIAKVPVEGVPNGAGKIVLVTRPADT